MRAPGICSLNTTTVVCFVVPRCDERHAGLETRVIDDDQLPFSQHTLTRLLHTAGFKIGHGQRQGNIKDQRRIEEQKRVFLTRMAQNDAQLIPDTLIFLDETWVNAGHRPWRFVHCRCVYLSFLSIRTCMPCPLFFVGI
jgi:hypothetical protein